jgi:DNA topoisomerase-1
MRTDSTNLSASAHEQIKSVVTKNFGASLYETHSYVKKSKNAQEAHEAIRPTHFKIESAGANEAEKRLYKLIWQRTVASQMADAMVSRTRIAVTVADGAVPDFHAHGTRVVSPGWLLADPAARGEDVELPKVTSKDQLSLLTLESLEKQTEPPPRYSEAGLVKELEKRGIGRPSTYASIIRTIEERGYVEKLGKALKPTDTGEVVSGFLEENFPNYISDGFTAEMEDNLDGIAEGNKDYVKTLKDFYGPFQKEIKAKEKTAKATTLGDADPSMKCPVCDSPMIIKLGRSGKFLSCSKFPKCTGGRTMEGVAMEGPKETGELCPDCKVGKLVEREGKYGKFIACGSYPKCKYIRTSPEEEAKAKTGVACPTCKTGEMMQRRGRFGIFFACSNYPKCRNAIKARPTGRFCKECGALMMEGTKTIPERCSVKTCPQHNPHKIEKIS